MTPSPGALLAGRFHLARPLGQGGSAEVWLAMDSADGAPVALKRFHDHDREAARALARHELACLERVSHPNVARALGLFEHDGQPLLAVQAVVPGADAASGARARTLASLRGAPAADWVVAVLQLADALAAVHEAGVVHRDIKVGNVLMDATGSILLVDFGVAAIVDGAAASAAHALRSGGSPLAMSPQQRAGEPAAAADDIYAFGVLLHELTYGRVPAVADERPPLRTTAGEGVAPGLVDLMHSCLASDPSNRPSDMRIVAESLATLAASELNHTLAPVVTTDLRRAETIRPAPRLHLSAGGAPHPRSGGRRGGDRRGTPWRLLGAVSAVWMLVLAGVLLTLLGPRVDPGVPVAGDPAPATPPVEAARRGDAGSAVVAPMEFARLRREREAMMDGVNRVLDLQRELERRAVQTWAATDYAQAVALAESGDEQFRDNEFSAAAETFAAAEAALSTLLDSAPTAAAAALSEAWSAYESGQAQTAIERFELAASIDPDLTEADAGLQRAKVLEQVLELRAEADSYMQGGAIREALERYEQILALDSQRSEARAATERLRARLDRTAFDRRMSEGFAALANDDFQAARSAFEAARKLDPDAVAVSDAIEQVGVQERARRLSALGDKAAALAAQEKWQQAAAAYSEALAIDATLSFATRGLAQAQQMAELYEQLSFYAADAMRLTDRSVRSRASAVLSRARDTQPRGPVLEQRQEELAQLLSASAQPVSVQLLSDNRTSVRILRGPELGSFERTQVSLRPGSYVALGTRDGFRDVRVEFTVTPGEDAPLVKVQCEERI